MARTNSVVLWTGPSIIDGAPLVVIASGLKGSSNAKTGAMLQTYILRADLDPVEAIRTAADASICGACPHRNPDGGFDGRSCYVNVGQGPLAVWRAWKRGAVPNAESVRMVGADRVVRLGTYGDPAAVPAAVWRELLVHAVGHTGYTHQWQEGRADALRPFVMASADTPEQAEQARAAGWRTFRVRLADEPLAAREFACPASAEAGKRTTCVECQACDGADRPGKASAAIIAHGAFAARFATATRARLA